MQRHEIAQLIQEKSRKAAEIAKQREELEELNKQIAKLEEASITAEHGGISRSEFGKLIISRNFAALYAVEPKNTYIQLMLDILECDIAENAELAIYTARCCAASKSPDTNFTTLFHYLTEYYPVDICEQIVDIAIPAVGKDIIAILNNKIRLGLDFLVRHRHIFGGQEFVIY